VNLIICLFITASVLIFGIVLPNENAAAQTTTKDLVGTWTLVSITIEREGKKIDFYGPNPPGQAMYDANGRVSSIITRSDLPKFASNNRQSIVSAVQSINRADGCRVGAGLMIQKNRC
jgi:hypothetical protein